MRFPYVRTATDEDRAKAGSASTQMAVALNNRGLNVYAGTVDPAEVARRRRRNKAARQARRVHRQASR